MLRTRLWMGSLLVALAIGAVLVDDQLAPWSPFLFVFVFGLALPACYELRRLLGPERCSPAWLSYPAVAGLLSVNWIGHSDWITESIPSLRAARWTWIAFAFTAIVLVAFLVEMARYREPGQSVNRIAATVFLVAYLGLLPSFLVQLRWLDDPATIEGVSRGTLGLALAIFVPKVGDIGAYFTGRLLGRHKMTPVLSPKKTWEGAAGGLTLATLTAVGIGQLGSVFCCVWSAIGFGIVVGVAGILGDLAESLIKRDCQQKDASQAVPGFGGVLDVVDSVIFAAPVAYVWLRW